MLNDACKSRHKSIGLLSFQARGYRLLQSLGNGSGLWEWLCGQVEQVDEIVSEVVRLQRLAMVSRVGVLDG